ncbi:unnamed protein product [Acanthoscelides obtectus]|uniref:DDE-1 domain-containing protein n=1 Tax=Acanthoscelides obtectus TaxID=200917 RepID=A0A9P0NT21_ACAOB|nr:unnamed protein product [Acanthoscelides obtectus]CAK1658083.1 hypothetical protein AOBTE_LOCUS20688 [Acanthoscelides obtectus]
MHFGNAIPPMLIFPRVHFKANMLKGGPVGSIGAANPSGWSNVDLFYKFMQHFANHVKPNIEKPTIILLDNHDSHISISTIDFCKANGIMLVTFHPHTSHKFQPLDRTVFGPLKTYYNKACSEWMLMHPAQPITIYDVAELIGKAFPQAFTPLNIQKGFKVAGLYPFDENIFQDHEFLASYVTDRPLIEKSNSSSDALPSASVDGLPSTSSDTFLVSCTSSEQDQSVITPETLRPFPKAPMRKRTGGRPKGKSRILTDTPEKEELERKRDLKTIKNVTKNLSKKDQKVKVTVKKRALDSSESESIPSLSSGEHETWEDIISEDREWLEIGTLQQLNEDYQFHRGDFVLVKVSGKKTIKYYVGEIISIGDENELRYLRRVNNTDKFVNDSAETYDFCPTDLVCKLPQPKTLKGTARHSSLLYFEVNFDNYNVS